MKAIWIVLLVAATTTVASVPLKDETYAYDPSVRALCQVRTVMYGPSMSAWLPQGEVLLRRLLREKDPLPFLVAVYNHGTPEAKAYALAGIHVLAPELFEICRKDIVGHYNPVITVQLGCMSTTTTFLEEVIRVDHGDYDSYLSGKGWRR